METRSLEIYIELAAEHFELPIENITGKHITFIKQQEYVRNYGYMGVPKRAYQVHDNGSVEFINPIL